MSTGRCQNCGGRFSAPRSAEQKFCSRSCWQASRKSVDYPQRRAALRYKYNLTLEDYEQLLASQGGSCAICGGEPEGRLNFDVDHDHACCPGTRSCGSCVRGLLCTSCNNILGRAKDSPELLLACVKYLQKGVK